MSTLLAMETRQHADVSPLPRTTGDIHPCFGGKGRFEYPGNSERFSRVVESVTPYGDLGQMFQATLGASYRVTHLPVQSNKNYRFSIWVKRNAHTAVASPQQACVMFGIDGNKVTTLDGNGSSDGWASGWALTPPFNEWCLMVVYLHSHRSFRTLSTGGCYHPSGRVMMSFCDFKQVVGTTEQELRFGLHTKQMQLGNAQSAYFFYPRVDEITGSEVSIAELLRGYGYNLFVREFDLHNGEHCDDDPELALTVDTLAEHSVTALKDVEDAGSGNIITSLERHQLNVALDKLCELDTRLERYVTIEQVSGEINPIPDTLVKRSVNSEIFATIMRAEMVEAEALVSTSDRRLKKNIKDDTLGLAFIEMLRPVRYHKMKVLHEEEAQSPTNEGEGADGTESPPSMFDMDGVPPNGAREGVSAAEVPTYYEERQTGLIAQEVEEALRKLGKEWSGHHVHANGIQAIQYGLLTIPLINAVKELSTRNRMLEKKVQSLEYRMNSMVRGLIGST